MNIFIEKEYITIRDFLITIGIDLSAVTVKQFLNSNTVKINGLLITSPRAKIRINNSIEINLQKYLIFNKNQQ